MLSLEFSDKKTPFIEMGTMGRLIFSKTLKNPTGYKWLCYIRKYTNMVEIKSAGERKKVSSPEQDAIMYTFKLYRDIDSYWGVKKGTIPVKIQKFLRKTFEKLCVEYDNILYFPDNKLDKFSEILENTDFEKMLNPPKQKRGKKRGRPKKINK